LEEVVLMGHFLREARQYNEENWITKEDLNYEFAIIVGKYLDSYFYRLKKGPLSNERKELIFSFLNDYDVLNLVFNPWTHEVIETVFDFIRNKENDNLQAHSVVKYLSIEMLKAARDNAIFYESMCEAVDLHIDAVMTLKED